MHRHTPFLCLPLLVLSAWLHAEEVPTVLPPVTVIGSQPQSLTSPALNEAEAQKTEVPGGFTLQGTEEMKPGRASNFRDLLANTPGVTLQSQNGVEATSISIRGS